MSTFTKTLNYTPANLPAQDVLTCAPLKSDGSAGSFVAGDPPAWGPSSDTSVVTLQAASPDGTQQNITLLKAGTAEVDVTCDGITTKITIRVNPTFAEMDVHTANPNFCQESPLQQG